MSRKKQPICRATNPVEAGRAMVQSLGAAVLTFGAMASACGAADAEDAVPKSGAWVRYHVLVHHAEGNQQVEQETLRFLGRATEKGQPCRWIEIQIDDKSGKQPRSYIYKLLIPEQALRESDRPLDHAVRGWVQSDKGRIDPWVRRGQALHNTFGRLLTFLPGCRPQTRPLDEPKVVDYQDGRLICPSGRAGQMKVNVAADDDRLTWEHNYVIWPHEQLPLGVAAANITTSLYRNDALLKSYRIEQWLEDFGTSAKSALPDHN